MEEGDGDGAIRGAEVGLAGARGARRVRGGPGQGREAGVAGDDEVLEQVRDEGHLGVAQVEVAQDAGPLIIG